jgi:hypothetical protein
MGESENKSDIGSKIIYWGIIVLVSSYIFASLIFSRVGPRSGHSNANECINNLRQIDAAINEWASVNGKTNGTVVTENDIKPYIKLDRHGNVPKCPDGGTYIYGKVGDRYQVTCSLSTNLPPHKLP